MADEWSEQAEERPAEEPLPEVTEAAPEEYVAPVVMKPAPRRAPRRGLRLVLILVLVLVVLAAAVGGYLAYNKYFPPKPAAVLAQMLAAYKGASSYHAEGTMKIDMQMSGMKNTMDMPTKVYYQAPNLFFTETGEGMTKSRVVCDGKNVYVEIGAFKSVLKMPAPKDMAGLTEYMSSGLGGVPSTGEGLEVLDYGALLQGTVKADQAASLCAGFDRKNEWLKALPQPGSCWVITLAAKSGPPVTLWVDARSHLLLQAAVELSMKDLMKGHAGAGESAMGGSLSGMTMKIAMQNAVVSVGKRAPESTFTYLAPAGMKTVEATGMQEAGEKLMEAAGAGGGGEPEKDLTGQAATDFTAKDMQGKPVKLSSFRGKPLVVDFWATWCGPCRQAMPILDEVYNQLKGRGLQVVVVSSDSDLQTVQDFLKKNPVSLTVLWLDPGSADSPKVDEAYVLQAIPRTVFIGADWKIKSASTGLHGKEALLKSVAGLGVDTSGTE